jgi:DNA polymerase I-like protein with 3'-5' exonuclease and polymerase domains
MISSNVVLDEKRLLDVRDYLLHTDSFVFDVETTGPYRGEPVKNQVLWMGLCTYGMCVTIPMGHPNGDKMVSPARRRKNKDTGTMDLIPAVFDAPPKQLRPTTVFDIMAPVFEHPEIEKTAHNAVFDLISIEKYLGFPVVGPYADTIVEAWLLDENRRLRLGDVIKRLYHREFKEDVGKAIETHGFSKAHTYTYLDNKYEWLAHRNFQAQIEAEGLQSVYELEMDVLEVLLDIKRNGVPVDVEELRSLESYLETKIVEIEGRVYKAAGRRFNLNSAPQKVEVFYAPKKQGGQGLKPWKLTKGALARREAAEEAGEKFTTTLSDWSTDKESLEMFEDNPVVGPFLEYQENARVLGTYVKGYLGDPGNPKKPGQIFDGLVFPDFVQYGTVSGRFSCRDPNLQNIPRPDTDLGKRIRGVFIPGPEEILVVSDYGQIEMVILAHFAGKGPLRTGFLKGIDPHTQTAAILNSNDIESFAARVLDGDPVAKKLRQISKNINFAVVFGAGTTKVASMSKIEYDEAKRFLDMHQRMFPEIYEFKKHLLSRARDKRPPHITTLLGRKRRVPMLNSSNKKLRSRAERQTVNSKIQGSAADLIKTAMVRAHRGLTEEQAGRIMLTVHDELVVTCPKDRADDGARILREAMVGEGIQKLVNIPLTIDLKIVERWSDAK